jgi:hypothetical protein
MMTPNMAPSRRGRSSRDSKPLSSCSRSGPCAMIVAVSIATFFGCSSGTDQKRGAAKSGRPAVVVSKDSLEIRGKPVAFPCSRAELSAALGEPSRVLSKINTILVWDELGIVGYVKPPGDEVEEILVAFRPRDFEFWPQKLFAGDVLIEGVTFNGEMTRADLSGLGFKQSTSLRMYWSKPVGTGGVLVAGVDEQGEMVSDISIAAPKRDTSDPAVKSQAK